MAERIDFLQGKQPVTFVDLFAGAGGISEGFLQAYTDSRYYDFVLASDINENCELTHRVRYNKQLGLDTDFLTEDIMSPTFLPHLLEALGGREVDVVTGGPSCQSFSLSGRRKRFDKRDGLFYHYLKVIRALRPKYFVMENVKGLLTKDKGRFKVEIMREIRSLIDERAVEALMRFSERLLRQSRSAFEAQTTLAKLQMEVASDDAKAEVYKEQFFDLLDMGLRRVTRQLDYRMSKSDPRINTIRHGLALLRRHSEREDISAKVVHEMSVCNIDNDSFATAMHDFLASVSDEHIIEQIITAIHAVEEFQELGKEREELEAGILLYGFSLDECLEQLEEISKEAGLHDEYGQILDSLRLYNVEQMVLTASDYGVPQNRERVVFIGSRKDQTPITHIPATVLPSERVTVYEALYDLDFIGNGEIRTAYEKPCVHTKWAPLIRQRSVDGVLDNTSSQAMTYAEWSKIGRLDHRFTFDMPPFYVKDKSALDQLNVIEPMCLFNHQTSMQNDTVMQRLKAIVAYGGYTDECKEALKERGLDSNKRNYAVLNPGGQSPTVVTMPDDFIHYASNRAMTVREMARLQSFDDSFVFQGKRQTGGDKRKSEVPQYTLVGNAVPPLMARAIGQEILKSIR